jgi:hypothetical protein
VGIPQFPLAPRHFPSIFSVLFLRNEYVANLHNHRPETVEGQPHLAVGQSQEKGRHRHACHGHYAYIRVSVKALKRGLVTKAPKRTWKKADAKAA